MQQTETAALGRFVRAGRESLCLVRAKDDALALETLFLAEDVYSPAEIAEAVEETKVKKSELDLARQIIDSLAGEFEPSALASEYRRDLRALLEAKMRGEEIVAPEPVEVAPVIDLMEALKASVAAAKRKAARAGERSPRASTQGAREGLARTVRLCAEASRADGLERRLEQRLVDLAVIDRYAFLDADADDLVAIHPRLLGELFGRQVVGHAASSGRENGKKKPAGADRARRAAGHSLPGGSSCPPLDSDNHPL